MPRSRPRALARALASRVRGSRAGQVEVRPSPDAGRATSGTPLLSVVMPAYNVADFLDEALESLRGQSLTDLEIIVVDDGSTDRTGAIARAHAAADSRVQVLTQPNAGQGAARNRGTALARGRFLTFMDADDVLPPRAYELAVGALEESGSDFCLGAVRRFDGTRTWRAAWVRESHREDLRGVTIEEHLASIKDIIACNRVYRREFWDRQIGGFPEGVAYEDHLPMLTAFLHGARFDVLTAETYLWRVRPDLSSTTNQKRDLQNLRDRATAKRQAWELLGHSASEEVRHAWLARVIDLDLTGYYAHGVEGDAAYRRELQDVVTTYWDLLSPDDLRRVRVRPTLLAWSIVRGAWDDLAALVAAFQDGLASTVVADPALPRLPREAVAPLVTAEVPDDLLLLAPAESRTVVRAGAPAWTAAGDLVLDARCEVARRPVAEAQVHLRLETAGTPVWSGESGEGVVVVPVTAVLEQSAAREVRLTASAQGAHGTAVAADLVLPVRPTTVVRDGAGWALTPTPTVDGLDLRIAPETTVVAHVTLSEGRIDLDLVGPDDVELRWRDREGGRSLPAPLEAGRAGSWPLDQFGKRGTWRLEARERPGAKFRPLRAPAGLAPARYGRAELGWTGTGLLRLRLGAS